MIWTVYVLYAGIFVSIFALCFSAFFGLRWLIVAAIAVAIAWAIGIVVVLKRKPKGFTRLQVIDGRVFLDGQPVQVHYADVREYLERRQQVGVEVRVRLPHGWEESRYWLENVDAQELAARLHEATGLEVTVSQEELPHSSTSMGGGGPSPGM